MSGTGVDVIGLNAYVRALQGIARKDLNTDLRAASKRIAEDIRPIIVDAVRRSGAPQASAMAATVRVHSDRVPVVVIGKVNPKFRSGYRRKGQSAAASRLRRGALAHGVVYGPKGGKRSTAAAENYYRIGRDDRGGTVGQAVSEAGPALAAARDAYVREYVVVLKRYGFKTFVGGRLMG